MELLIDIYVSDVQQNVNKAINDSNGNLLLTAPTGAGKSQAVFNFAEQHPNLKIAGTCISNKLYKISSTLSAFSGSHIAESNRTAINNGNPTIKIIERDNNNLNGKDKVFTREEAMEALLEQKIIKNFNGKLPDNFEDLISLPGIGNYTASAILAIAFNKPLIPLDGNVERVLKRYLYLILHQLDLILKLSMLSLILSFHFLAKYIQS